jgi:hypothetical protein
MSQENVELVRSAYSTLFGSEEWSAWVEEFIAPDFEIEDRTLPEVSQGLRGPDAAYAEASYLRESFDEVRYEVEDLQQLSDDRVLVRVRASARGLASGLQIDGTIGHLWAMKARKVTRLDVYGTWADALKAVGLAE